MLNLPPVGNTNGNGLSGVRRFGVFEVDLRAGELRRNGIKVKLQDQPLQVLAALLDQPGEIVTREELRNRLWPADTFVDFDHSLNAAIRRLRDALGDSAENPTFVETVARRGYRFLAPVTEVPQNGHDVEVEPPLLTPVVATPHFQRRWLAAVVVALILLASGLVIGFHISQNPPGPGRTTGLTANPSGDPVRTAAISRDGRHLAFVDDTGFYLRQIDTGETHPIALPKGMQATYVSWVPDSDHVVVALASNGWPTNLWEISVVGGSARRIIDNGSQPAVSPNGKQIAFVAGPPLHERIWLASMFGESPHELIGQDGDLFGTISWSPDGRRIAYTTARYTYGYGTKGTIAVADLSDAELHGARAHPNSVLSVFGLSGPMVWAADGRLIYTIEEPRPRQQDSNLWSIRLNAQSKPEGAPVRLTNDQGGVFAVSASGDSKRIAYVKGVPQPDVYVARLQASGVLEEPIRLTLDDRSDLPFDWTTDNKSVIFISDRTGNFNIYKQSVDQNMPDLIMSSSQQLQGPRLSPDGSHLLYLVNPNGPDPNYEVPLMSMPLAGGPSQQLAKGKWITNLQCSRSPATVCVYGLNVDRGITFFRFDSEQGRATKVLEINDELAEAYNWTLSPDGTTLALAKGKWGSAEPRIRLVSLAGAPDRWLTIQGWPGIESIDWAADSKSIWAATTGERENALLRIDLQGKATPVWRPKNIHVRWAIPSRDGKLLALHVDSNSANVWMLEH